MRYFCLLYHLLQPLYSCDLGDKVRECLREINKLRI
ncbi:hypothetical protein GE061_014871, partial [Apolygus lucorum]